MLNQGKWCLKVRLKFEGPKKENGASEASGQLAKEQPAVGGGGVLRRVQCRDLVRKIS